MLVARSSLWKKLSLSFFSLLFSLALLEIVFRIAAPARSSGVGTTETEKASLYGWAMPPRLHFGVTDPDTRKVHFFRMNSEGWKDVEHSRVKPAGIVRILFLGDSNTYGVVPIQQQYTRKVEEILHERGKVNVEVVSIALGGWGTDQAFEALIHEGVLYKPDLVIYQFCDNDVTDNLMPNEGTPKDQIQWKKPFRYELEDGQLVRRTLIPPGPESGKREPENSWYEKLVSKSALLSNIKQFRSGSTPSQKAAREKERPQGAGINPTSPFNMFAVGEESPQLKDAWRLLEALLLEMKGVTDKQGGQFLVFSESGDHGKRAWFINQKLMHTDDTSDYFLWEGKRYPADFERPLKDIAEICKRNGIPLIQPQRLYVRYQNDAHANAEGNLNMASDIVDFLLQHGFV